MEWLETARPWIVPVVVSCSFVIAITPKLRLFVIGSLGIDGITASIENLDKSIDRLGRDMKEEFKDVRSELKTIQSELKSEIKEVRAEMKKEHEMLHQDFTKHLIDLHGQRQGNTP